MNNYLPVFRNASGEKLVLQAYDAIMASWPVPYEDLFIPTKLGLTHIIACGPEAAPPIILIHAYYASAASWFRNVKSLSGSHRVYALDIIGDPNKSKPYRPVRILSEFIDWFDDVLNELRIKRADFIGNSVGAFHIVNYAFHVPERIGKMILIGPAATFLKITPFYIHTFPGGITGWSFLVKHAMHWIENGAPFIPEFDRLFYSVLKYGKAANQVFPVVFEDERLRQIKNPVLLVYGDKEVIYDYEYAIRRAQQCLPDAKVAIIPGANHLTAVSQPEQVNDVMINFLK